MMRDSIMNNYDLARKSQQIDKQTNNWLAKQGIDPERLTQCDHAKDIGRLIEIKPFWNYVVEQDRSQWLGLWYRVYKRNLPLTETHRLYFRNILKRAKRLSRRK